MTVRIPPVKYESASAAQRQALDEVKRALGKVPNLHATLGQAPRVLSDLVGMQAALGKGAQRARSPADRSLRLAAERVSLLRVARREGLSPDDALDAVQEALQSFLGLPQARGVAGQDDDARALLSKLVRNLARNRRRCHDRSREHVLLSALEPDGGPRRRSCCSGRRSRCCSSAA